MGRRRARLERSEGFTLLELMIAISILALVMAALAPGFYNALVGATVAGQRNAATGLAVQAIETARSESYSSVPLGCLGPTSSAVGRVDYSVNECVQWAPAEAGCPYPYKEVSVKVSWPASAPVGSVEQASDIYPGNQGPCSTATTTTPSTTVSPLAPSPPIDLASSAPASPADQGEVDLTWKAPTSTPAPIAYYQVWYSTSATGFGSTSTYTVAGDSTTPPSPPTSPAFAVTGLSAGTTYYFEAWSVSSSGVMSSTPDGPIQAATASAPSPSTCDVESLGVNPTSGVVDHDGYLTNATDFSLSAQVNGSCSGVTVDYTADGSLQSTSLSGTSPTLTGTAGGPGTTWAPGDDTFQVYVSGVATSVEDSVQICQTNGNSGHGC